MSKNIFFENKGPFKLKDLFPNQSNSKAKFIAVTGSVGKTGTKDMMHLALSKVASTYSNESSYNNYLGVPLSLARVPPNLNYCILVRIVSKSGKLFPSISFNFLESEVNKTILFNKND